MTLEELKPYLKEASVCPLCDGRDFKIAFDLPNIKVAECQGCHFRFANPYLSDKGMGYLYENSEVLSKINPLLADYYDYSFDQDRNLTKQDYISVLNCAQEALQGVSRSLKLFEVGYGTGHFLLEAAQRGWDVDGIDTSADNCKTLAENHRLVVRQGTFDDYPLPSGAYDCVAFWDVIEHTIHPKDFIKKAYDMMKPNGLLVVATPNIDSLLNQLFDLPYRISFGRTKLTAAKAYVVEHVGYFSKKTLLNLVKEQGFEPVRILTSESDIGRYRLSFPVRSCLRLVFWFARLLRMRNRIIVIARKKEKKI